MSAQGGLPDERFTILQMVQDGTISPDDGARLLEAMDRVERTAPPSPPKAPAPRSVHVRISNASGNHDLDLVLPFGLVATGLRIANRVAPDKVPELSEVRKSVESGYVGKLFNVESGNDHIEISIEEG